MKIISLTVSLIVAFGVGCAANSPQTEKNTEIHSAGGQASATAENTNVSPNLNINSNAANSTFAESPNGEPKTVRDFFKLLPAEYFTLEGCEPAKDKNCDKARAEYLKNFLEVEDIPNGYLKGGCDGGQSCIVMTLFKRPNASYVIAVNTEFEAGTNNYFLDYSNGKWTDISAEIIPQFSKKNFYELPRQGTTIQVFAKKMTDGYEDGKGEKLYDLVWKDGKFSKR